MKLRGDKPYHAARNFRRVKEQYPEVNPTWVNPRAPRSAQERAGAPRSAHERPGAPRAPRRASAPSGRNERAPRASAPRGRAASPRRVDDMNYDVGPKQYELHFVSPRLRICLESRRGFRSHPSASFCIFFTGEPRRAASPRLRIGLEIPQRIQIISSGLVLYLLHRQA